MKQVIVMRRYFPDGKGGQKMVRTGKMIAQACHASMAFMSKKVASGAKFSDDEKEWVKGSFAKICVYVDTEEELIEIFDRANEAKLSVHIIKDSGLTEFNNMPTYTCLAIGPHRSEIIDPITGHLKLM